jgi:hypothetical protein
MDEIGRSASVEEINPAGGFFGVNLFNADR